MYPDGLEFLSYVRACLSTGILHQLGVLIPLLALYWAIVGRWSGQSLDAPRSLLSFSPIRCVSFLTQRHRFLSLLSRESGDKIYQFRLLWTPVIVVSGESGRDQFFRARDLNLNEGFAFLSGAIPMMRGVTSELHTKRIGIIHRRLHDLQKDVNLQFLIPHLVVDTRKMMEAWGSSGQLDPFEKIYEVLFQLTVRSISCAELADDPKCVAELKALYDTLDRCTTPASVLLPWLPTLATLKKLRATKRIYDIVSRFVDGRQQSGVTQVDALQMLVDNKDEKLVAVGFIMGLLVAGARATGVTASWLIVYLSAYPDWCAKAAAEIKNLLDECSETSTGQTPAQLTLAELSARLSDIPLDAWEKRTPVLDSLISETMRVAQPHTAMRRNIGKPFQIDNKLIPHGAYVIYPFSDVHLDPELYPDPWVFNPDRKMTREALFGYVGWGGGHTICLGQRLAKLELKIVAAMTVLGFHCSVVDESGNIATPPPSPDWNDTLLCRPSTGTLALKYMRHE